MDYCFKRQGDQILLQKRNPIFFAKNPAKKLKDLVKNRISE